MNNAIGYTREPANKKNNALTITLIVILTIAILILICTLFICSPMLVKGDSMTPTLQNNKLIFVQKAFVTPTLGDIVVFNRPQENYKVIKRVIGVEGDTISIVKGKVLRNGEEIKEEYIGEMPTYTVPGADSSWKVGKNQLFVLGDNRSISIDSRTYGCIDMNLLVGKLI